MCASPTLGAHPVYTSCFFITLLQHSTLLVGNCTVHPLTFSIAFLLMSQHVQAKGIAVVVVLFFNLFTLYLESA